MIFKKYVLKGAKNLKEQEKEYRKAIKKIEDNEKFTPKWYIYFKELQDQKARLKILQAEYEHYNLD